MPQQDLPMPSAVCPLRSDKTFRVLHVLFDFAVVSLLLVSLFLLVCQYLADPTAFNSDNLLSSAQCEDLLHGRDVTDWHLPGAPYVFPDLLLLLPCQALTPTLPAAFLAYCLLLHLSITAVLTWLGILTGLHWRTALAAAGCGGILLVSLHVGYHDLHRCWLLVHPGSHLGAIFTGLFLLALTVHLLKRQRSWIAFGFFLGVGSLGIFSDNLVAAQFLAPLGLALLLLTARRFLSVRQTGSLLVLLAASFLLALAIKFAFRRLGFHFLEVEMSFGRLRLPDLFSMLRTLYHGIEHEHLLCALIALHLLSALFLLQHWFRRLVPTSDEDGFPRTAVLLTASTIVLSPPCILGILFVARMTHQPAIPRYTLSCWFLPPLLLPLLLCWLPGRIALTSRGCVQAGILGCAVWQAYALLPHINGARFEQPYPPLAQALDRLARERGSMVGLGGFWLARGTSWFTREPIVINAISPLGEPWFHASNPARFLPDSDAELRVPKYQFVVLRHGDPFAPSPALLALQFGEPAEKIVVGNEEIWLYDSLRTPPFDLFLRARLADRLTRRHPYQGPSEPTCLARPKANMTPANARGTVAIEPGQACEVRFAEPMTGRLLDVGASDDARLELEFFRGEKRLCRLPVPSVPWTGACYDKSGLQSRLLTLPESLRNQGWDRIVVHASERAPAVSLGHVLVFAESVPGLDEQPRPIPHPQRMRMEAENLFPLNPGTPYTDDADSTASGGRVRRAAVDFHCCFAYTPRLFLPPGHYRLECALKVDKNVADDIGSLAVTTATTHAVLSEHSLSCKDSVAGLWITQQLTFKIDEECEGVQFGIVSLGKTPITVDYFDLVAESVVSCAEKK